MSTMETPVVPMAVDGGYGQSLATQTMMGENSRKTLFKMQQARERLARMRWDACTLVNLYPMPTSPTGYVYDSVCRQVLPAPLEDEGATWFTREKDGLRLPYSVHVQTTYYLDRLQKEDEGQDIQEILPLELMQGIVDQQNGSTGGGGRTRGGMFCVIGAKVDPFEDWKAAAFLGRESQQMTVRDAFTAAFSMMMTNFDVLYQEAEQHWAEKHSQMGRRITKEHRIAARYMKMAGVIPKLPSWIEARVKGGVPTPICPECGTEGNPGAPFCKACKAIIDPFEAYKRKLIDPFDPVGARALRRLSREQLDELGLEDLETHEEYVERLRAQVAEEETEAGGEAHPGRRGGKAKTAGKEKEKE